MHSARTSPTHDTGVEVIMTLCPNFIPPEILGEIFSIAWLSPMTPNARRAFFSSTRLVAKLWDEELRRVCATNSIVFSSAHFEYWRCSSSEQPTLPHDICLTFERQYRVLRTDERVRRDLFMTFRRLRFRLKNLTRLSVAYYPSVPRPREKSHFSTDSVRVVRLHLKYILSADLDDWVLKELGLRGKRDMKQTIPSPCACPNLEHVSFPSGDEEGALSTFLCATPHLQIAKDEKSKIKVQIQWASERLPPGCHIVHGVLDSPVETSVSNLEMPYLFPAFEKEFRPETAIHGKGLGLIFGGKETLQHGEDAQTWRTVHVFVPQY